MKNNIELGESALYPERYDASLLEPIARNLSRDTLQLASPLPFDGVDIWTGYELSWLTPSGKPQVAIAEFEFLADSTHIVESKSFKYYLNSFNQTIFQDWAAVQKTLIGDLQKNSGAEVKVSLFTPDQFTTSTGLVGMCVDDIDVSVDHYIPDRDLLKTTAERVINQQLYSHLLKSNCPVTGQPDWASVWIEYSGEKISPDSFLRYIISYRQHQDFHENCVERIFNDIAHQCSTESLSVYARYTRRGGLDINPFRSDSKRELPFRRVARQ